VLDALRREIGEETGWRDGGLVRHLAELALRSSRPAELVEPHATVFLHAAGDGCATRCWAWPGIAWRSHRT
jgi:hypothetical protein